MEKEEGQVSGSLSSTSVLCEAGVTSLIALSLMDGCCWKRFNGYCWQLNERTSESPCWSCNDLFENKIIVVCSKFV